MARKVFISFLGTSFYQPGKYLRDDFCSTETRFVQAATLQYLQRTARWDKDDSAIILLTQKARASNWVDHGPHPHKTETYPGLRTELQSLGLPFEPVAVDVPDGNSEADILEIFSLLFNELQPGDELYFDVTHGFRSLPMLAIVLGNYAKFLKGTVVRSITYGNWEAHDDNTALIVDLQVLSNLQDWTFAAADYLENGNARLLSQLSSQKAERLAGLLSSFSQDMQLCRGLNIAQSQTITAILHTLEEYSSSDDATLTPILREIQSRLQGFEATAASGISIKNGFEAARWCNRHGMFQQALTILEENIVTYFCHKHDIAINATFKRGRINNAIEIARTDKPEAEWKVANETERARIKDILGDKQLADRQFLERFHQLSSLRNDINHSGMRDKPKPANDFYGEVEQYINYFADLLDT